MNVSFWHLKEYSESGTILCIADIRNSFHHSFSMFEQRHTFVLNATFQEKTHLQWHLEMFCVSPRKWKSVGHTSQKTNLFVLQREYCGLDVWTWIEDFDNHFLKENEKSFEHTKFYKTHCLRSEDVPNKVKNAMEVRTIKVEVATHRKWFQMNLTCLQGRINSCRQGELRDGYGCLLL